MFCCSTVRFATGFLGRIGSPVPVGGGEAEVVGAIVQVGLAVDLGLVVWAGPVAVGVHVQAPLNASSGPTQPKDAATTHEIPTRNDRKRTNEPARPERPKRFDVEPRRIGPNAAGTS